MTEVAIEDVRTDILREHFAATAGDVDTGTRDVREGLRWLGEQKALTSGGDRTQRCSRTVRLLRAVAAASLADAFAVWSQTMVIEYLSDASSFPTSNGVLPQLTAGQVTGATGMAPAVSDLAGRQPVPVDAEPEDGGWRLSGTIPWASNLFPDAVVVLPAKTAAGGRIVAAVRIGTPGVQVRSPGRLLALDATASGSVELDSARVAADAVLGHNLARFMSRCQPVMLLSQAAMALGIADAALDSAGDVLDRADDYLADEYRTLTARRDGLAEQLETLAAEQSCPEPSQPASTRLDALALVHPAVELEGQLRAGTGFRAASPTSRRRREAAFLPLQAPTPIQLRALATRP